MKLFDFAASLAISFACILTTQAAFIGQEAKLTGADAARGDEFGHSVAISGNTALVGARAMNSGSAYLFDVPTGNQLTKLTSSDVAPGDGFGYSVAISGNTALVGAYADDDGGFISGSAYLFDITTGNQLSKLTADDAAPYDLFGNSVAISGSTALIGALLDDDGGTDSGSAYLFDVTTGNQLTKLTSSDAAAGDGFGFSVAISGNTALVGAWRDDDGGIDSGSAYLFDIITGNQLTKLTSSDAAAGDRFGISVAISGNVVLVGADLDDDGGYASGSAYLFDITTGNQLAKLTAVDAAVGDQFGNSVAISGNTALVGAAGDDGGGFNFGSAYLFDVTTGNQLSKLTADDAAGGDQFGGSVAISGSSALVGAALDNDGGTDSGSAYLYRNVPEPSSLLLSTMACLGLLFRRTR